MKRLFTIRTKNNLNFYTKAFLSFALLLSMSFAGKAQSPYCDPNQSYSCYTYNMSINAVDILDGSTSLYSRSHNASGFGGCSASTGYYTLWSTSSMFTLKCGTTYKMGFTTGQSYNVNIMIWIDLNKDNDFADAGEFLSVPTCYYGSGNVSAGSTTLKYFDVKIPKGSPGVTRMRIRSSYYYTTCPPSTDDACSNIPYGEAEDYTITLQAAGNDDATAASIVTPGCGQATTVKVTNFGANNLNSVQIGWMVNGTAQTVNSYSSTLAPGASANITLKNTGGTDYNFVDGTTYTLKVFTFSPNGNSDIDKTDDTARLTFKYVSPAGTPTTTDTKRCGLGTAPLVCTTPFNTDSVVWYNAATGGNLIAKGKKATSPSLTLGVNTFYAQAFKMGAPQNIANALGQYTYWTGSPSYYNGGMCDITPKGSINIDSFAVRLTGYNNTSGVTFDVYMKTGTYKGSEADPTKWTKIVNNKASRCRYVSSTGAWMAYVAVPEIALNPGTTYGFYITTTTTVGSDLWASQYAASGLTYSNNDLTVFQDNLIYGSGSPFGTKVNGYPIGLQTFYRGAICPSARIPLKITVNPSPFGATFTKGTPFQTTMATTTGTLNNPDIVAKGDQLTWDLTPPTGYTNSDYGTTWLTTSPVIKTKKGTTLDPKFWSFAAPSGTTAGKLIFKPDATIVDSFYIVSMLIKNISTTFCDSTILRHIFVAPRPVPNFKFNSPICDGDAVLFNDDSKISSGGITYKYDFNTGNPADTVTVNTTVFKFPTFGTYQVTLTTTSTPYGYKESVTIPVVVTEIPKIGFKVLNACEKVAVSFSNSTTIGAGTITYAWDFGEPGNPLAKSTAKNPTWTYKNAGAYKVTLRATASGCTSELSKNANQFAVPVASFELPKGAICDKSDVQFTNTSTIKMGNMGYTWDFGDGGVSNFANPVHQFTTSTSKQVKMKTVSEFGCTDSVIKTVNLAEAPNADFSWGPACNLSNTNFTFTGTKPAGYLTTFNWNFAGEGSTTLENPSKLFSVVGRKDVTLTLVSNNGCSDVVTKDVNVKLQSKADFTISDVCEDDDAVFTNKSTVSQGSLLYNWKFGDLATSSSQSPRHRYNIGGVSQTFNVTLVAIVPGGCSDSISLPVSVNAKPKSDFTFNTSGRQVNFKATQAGNTLYQWRFGDGGSSNSANTIYNYLNFPTGKYNACLAVVNAAGCFSETCKEVSITGGVDKLTKLTDVQVYPNPNKGSFTVTVEDPKSDISIAVYNLLGDVVKTIDTNPLKSVYSVDLNVANGVYMVKVTNGGLTSTQKVTINK